MGAGDRHPESRPLSGTAQVSPSSRWQRLEGDPVHEVEVDHRAYEIEDHQLVLL